MTTNDHREIKAFGEYLKENSVLSQSDCSRMIAASSSTGQSIDTVLVELGLVREEDLARHLAVYSGIRMHRLSRPDLSDDLIERIGVGFLTNAGIVPITRNDDNIALVVADPLSAGDVGMISYLLDMQFDLFCAPRSHITELLGQWNAEHNAELADVSSQYEHSAELELQDVNRLKDVANEAPVIRLVNDVIQRAVDRNATDIHIEPSADSVSIRFRCDGVLILDHRASQKLHAGLSTRLKILAHLNIAETRMPQDGRMRVAVRGQEIDLRVSVLPSVHGETFVLRILDRSTVPLKLDSLGYGSADVQRIKRLSQLRDGIVLVTGPTGSGKTTTLYSMINEIDSDRIKVFTVEDPVEYRIDGITQVQVNSTIGLDFSTTLRTVLRQDPDVILVGEIRDAETARIAIRAALTGHLVFSTLHTNSAAAAFSRLIDMGIEGYLLAGTVRAIIGQRLLRRRCGSCADNTTDSCERCGGGGYQGRLATYEILEVSRGVHHAVNQSATETDVLDAAQTTGFVSLKDHARGLVASGLTDKAEVERVLSGLGDA
ncbi:GspE/PulE family protein [Hoeflea poritis]|uniref:GspE/PulE family protein n=1 Tax=Hoeflea poritis TaxID=2993659 RepID=A0ABT4VVU8_9HYPH|nr:GspE/PulE family protein [Hoeflea poritis]MDA4848839.1 GspE/PulE family protein [Hoeflea poritis]